MSTIPLSLAEDHAGSHAVSRRHAGVEPEVARAAFRLAAHKLPIRTRFVEREHHS